MMQNWVGLQFTKGNSINPKMPFWTFPCYFSCKKVSDLKQLNRLFRIF